MTCGLTLDAATSIILKTIFLFFPPIQSTDNDRRVVPSEMPFVICLFGKLRDSCNSLSASHQLAVFAECYKYDSYSLVILTRCYFHYRKSFIYQLVFNKAA